MGSAYAEVSAAAPGTRRVCPRALLKRAHRATAVARTPGASTADILSSGRRTLSLRWAYVDDSGFAVFRDGRILRRSRPQQHSFNKPYQLSSNPGTSDAAAAAAVGKVAVREGDVVVLGTGGLFDNVFDHELARIVRMGTALGVSPRKMAEAMADFACKAATSPGRDTPYSVLRRRQAGKDFYAGRKPDDITVVVAYIVS